MAPQLILIQLKKKNFYLQSHTSISDIYHFNDFTIILKCKQVNK